ncbi:hypothetical protein [Aeromonas caviae]|uniref:hypothetical protein n=1 Tax=Aeromonas caviae TaxID=648 RepID=UPI002B48E9CF|nr:hypothetical protein [Aeromonas caviae]
MIPEPWSIDDNDEVPDEATAKLALVALEREADEYWASPAGRQMSADLDSMLIAGLDPLNFDRIPAAALDVARWRVDNLRQPTVTDRETLNKALEGELFGLGRKVEGKTPMLTRKRQLEAVYLLDELKLTKKNAADLMGRGVNKENIIDLAASGRSGDGNLYNFQQFDRDLVDKIKKEHERGQKEAKTDARKAAQYTPRKRTRK